MPSRNPSAATLGGGEPVFKEYDEVPLELQEAWDLKPHYGLTAALYGSRNYTRVAQAQFFQSGTLELMPRTLALFPVHPTSWKRVLFDTLSIFVLLYDSVTIPFVFAWDVDLVGPWRAISWTTLAFWVLDIILNFTTGFIKNDKLEMKMSAICWHYLRSGFLMDFTVVLFDLAGLVVAEVTAGQDSGGGETLILRLIRFGKVGRVVRIIAKIRMGLLARIDHFLIFAAGKLGVAQHVHFILTFMKLTFVILWLTHIGCCMWYAVASGSSSLFGADASWRRVIDQQRAHGGDTYVYLQGLYWAVSTMFSGASFMTPSNSLEAAFSQLYIICSGLFVSSLTSSLAAMLIQAQMVKQEQVKKLRTLSKYLDQHKITPLLSISIREQIWARMATEKRLADVDVPCLSLLSSRLSTELRYSMYSKSFLKGHAFFRACNLVDNAFLREICFSATVDISTGPGETVFDPGTAMERAYVSLWGSLRYARLPVEESSASLGQAVGRSTNGGRWSRRRAQTLLSRVEVEVGQWICEAALWVNWSSVGSLEANSSSNLLGVEVDAFLKALSSHPDVAVIARSYGGKLYTSLMQAGVEATTDLENGIDADSLLASLPSEQRLMVSLPVYDQLHHYPHNGFVGLFQPRTKGVDDLREELQAGKCHLVLDDSGVVLRVVLLVALRLTRDDDQLCVRMAELTNERRISGIHVQVPGTKVRHDELPEESLERLLSEEFGALRPFIEVGDHEVCISQQGSKSYGVDTKYIRRIYHASLSEPNPICPPGGPKPARSWRPGVPDWQPFVAESRRGLDLYAWMELREFERLEAHGAQAKDEVAQWMTTFSLDDIRVLPAQPAAGTLPPDPMHDMI